MNIEECLKKGLLKKERPDLEKSKQSIKICDQKFAGAKKSLEVELIESTIILSYTAMFHAARALLFKEGFREKSHAAVIVFLKEKYSKKLGSELIYEFNTLRFERHDSLYGLEVPYSKKDAEHALKTAKEFIEQVKKILTD